jgi:hypothetical protein
MATLPSLRTEIMVVPWNVKCGLDMFINLSLKVIFKLLLVAKEAKPFLS